MSKLEQMAYKMQPAGHDAPEPKRKYEKPQNKLKEAYEKWLKLNDYSNYDEVSDNVTPCYESALQLTRKLEFSLADVHGLLLEYMDNLKPHLAGLFASALYRRVPEKEITFDLPIEQRLDFIGFKLPKDKTLISKIPTRQDLGKFAGGTIVNANDTADGFGNQSTGIIINYGETGNQPCTGAKGAIINYGNCGEHFAGVARFVVINAGVTGGNFADGAQGIAINLGTADECMGIELGYHGMLINYGKAGRGLGENALGLILCFKNPKSYDEDTTQCILKKPRQCAKYVELRKYLDNLTIKLEKGRKDYRTAIKLAQQLDRKTIEDKLPSALIEQHQEIERDDSEPDFEPMEEDDDS